MAKRIIHIGKGKYIGNTNVVLQRAVDDMAAKGGGVVVLPAGVFTMHDSLHLKSHVSVVGQGSKTVLRKKPCVKSRIVDYLGYGHFEVTVEEPELFEPGMGVLVRDDARAGFDMTVATVTGKLGNRVFISKMMNYDYHPDKNGRLVSVFPLIASEFARDVSVCHLTLDGNNDAEVMGGCRGGGVFLLQTHTATIECVEVHSYNGDGISFQQCTDVVVRGCSIHHCAENGLHPGSGSVRYVMAGNHIHDCGGMGVFYCLRTTHSLCADNKLVGNGRAGISIGERDTDHILRGNEIRDNGWEGIVFRKVHAHGGDRVVIEQNVLDGNCKQQGEAEVVVASRIEDVELRRNTFRHVRKVPLFVEKGARNVYAVRNRVDGRALSRNDVVDGSGSVVLGEPQKPLSVGPAAASPDSGLHLNVKLPRKPANFKL
jgi:hypothetical protein